MTTHWHFVIAAYAVTALGTAAVVAHSWLTMRAAERRADALTRRAPPPETSSET